MNPTDNATAPIRLVRACILLVACSPPSFTLFGLPSGSFSGGLGLVCPHTRIGHHLLLSSGADAGHRIRPVLL